MTEQRLNNSAMLHIHKDVVDEMELEPIAADFAGANDERIRYFGSFRS